MKLIAEKLFPYIMAILAVVLWKRLGGQLPESEDILTATLTVSGIFVGFLATSKAILLSMSSPIIDDLKKSGYINELVSYIAQAIWVNLAFCAVNVLGYFLDHQGSYFGLLWIAFSVAAISCFIRVTHIMLKVFRYAET